MQEVFHLLVQNHFNKLIFYCFFNPIGCCELKNST